MALNNKLIVLDIDKRFNRLLLGKSLDTTGARSYTMRVLYSNLALDLTGMTVQVGGIKPDGFGILSSCKVIDATKGIIEVDFTTQMLTTPGILKLEIVFLKDDIRLSSIPFEVEVIQSVTNYNQVISSNDFLVFQDELKKIRAQMNLEVDKINTRYNETESKANKLIDDMQKTVDGTIAEEVYQNKYKNYTGSSLTCNDTLNGRTKGMCIKGSTKYQKLDGTLIDAWEKDVIIKNSGDLNDNTINIYSINRDISLVWRGNLLIYKPQVEGDYIVSPKINNYYGLMINITNIPTGKEIKIVSPGIFNRITTFSKTFINNDSLDESSKIRSIYEINTGTNKISFVKSSNENYLFIGCYDLMKMNRQIELNILDFDKKEISLPIEGLKGLPNGVCNMIYKNNLKFVLEQRIKGCLLNGEENWTKHLENEKYISFFKPTVDAAANINNKSIISDKFMSATYSEYNSLQFESISLNNSDSKLILISILKDKLETKDSMGFKKWLQANPIKVYYQLSESIYHKITNLIDIDLDTYKDITYIKSENKIKPILDFKVPITLRTNISENGKEISNITKKTNNIIFNLPYIDYQNTCKVPLQSYKKNFLGYNNFSKKTFGRREQATVTSVIANCDNPFPQVLGAETKGLATYTNRDSVALYTENTGNGALMTITSGLQYGENFVDLPLGIDTSSIKVGMILDAGIKPNDNRFVGIVKNISNNKLILEDGWWQVRTDSQEPTKGIPSPTQPLKIQWNNKTWVINSNLIINEGTEAGANLELGVLSNTKNINDVGGIDLINMREATHYGFKARSGQKAGFLEGFKSINNGVHFSGSGNGDVPLLKGVDEQGEIYSILTNGTITKARFSAKVCTTSLSVKEDITIYIIKGNDLDLLLPPSSTSSGRVIEVISMGTGNTLTAATGNGIITPDSNTQQISITCGDKRLKSFRFVADGGNVWIQL